jgi:hypothetical protein
MVLIHTENRAGKPIDADGTILVPIEKSTRIQPSGMWGFLIWRRPAAVVVQYSNGSEEIIQIQDSTRRAQIFLIIIGVLGSVVIWLFNKD